MACAAKTLSRISEVTLPPHESDKALADQFASFFPNKIKTIRDISSPLALKRMFILLLILRKLLPLLKFVKILSIKSSVTRLRNSVCWILGLHFSSQECSDILLPSITKLVNCSLMEGCAPDGFKTAVVSPLVKQATLPAYDFKNNRPISGLSFISKLVEQVVAKQLLEHIHVHSLDNPY